MMMPKQKYWLYGILILAVIGIVLISGCIQQKDEKVGEVQVYKGIWLAGLSVLGPDYLASNIQKLKDIGINAVFLAGLPALPDSYFEKQSFPPVVLEKIKEILPIEKELLIADIQTAHKNGLKVVLTVSIDPKPEREEINLEAWNSKIVKYAKLAEEYNVELFAPMAEPEGLFDDKEIEKWGQEILFRIKEVYHGEVVWMGCGTGGEPQSEEFLKELSEGPTGRYAGYDYIGFGINLVPGMTLEEFPQYVDNCIKYKLAQAERDNCKGIMITEFAVWLPTQRSEEEVARAHEIVLEKAKDYDKVFGLFVGNILGGQIEGLPPVEEEIKTEEVIRRWFKEI
ncbi:hypothetical protein ES707_06955 [subsurface metagenome]